MNAPHRIACHAALALHDLAGVVVCAVLLTCAFPDRAHAYVDPSVLTYTIQALAGVAVALSAVAGVAFRRSRKALMRALGIDENAHKETEPPVHRLDALGEPVGVDAGANAGASASEGATATPPETPAPSRNRHAGSGLKWPSRLWRALLASAFLVGTVAIVAPVEMVAGSTSLLFGLGNIWQPLLANAGIAALALALVISLFPGRAFDVLMALVVALGVCFYVQALFMNQSLPAADGHLFYLEDHLDIVVPSTIAWVAILVGFIALAIAKPPLGRGIGVIVSLALVIVQGVAVTSVFADPQYFHSATTHTSATDTSTDQPPIITKEGLYELSPKGNVVIFVLDAFDVINLDRLMWVEPGILDEMGGFTYFRNSTGSSVPTRYGIPFLLTGSWPRADETWQHYIDNRYTSTTFTDDIVAQGYSLYVYTDTTGPGGTEYLAERATNIRPISETETHTESSFNLEAALMKVYKMALYRDMPWVAKEPFWFFTDEVNRAAFDVETREQEIVGDGRVGSTSLYVIDDAKYYRELQQRRLSIFDDGAEKGSVHFIHLFGAHQPYTLDADGTYASSGLTSVDRQCIGSMRMVSEYLHQMKELGVYDDATIIITADHGLWEWDYTIEQSEWEGDMAGGPIMLVKQPTTPEQSAQPCAVSDVRTGHVDYPATVIAAVGGDTAKYGETVFDEHNPNRVRYYYWPTHNGTHDLTIYEYAIDGNVTNWYAWKRTGVEWEYNGSTATLT